MTGAQPARILPPAVSWSPEAANKLRRLAIGGLLALPKRGIEIGGLLLGSVSDRAPYLVSIEDLCPIATEHRSGPGFVLSEDDHIGLRELLARIRGSSEHFVVGYYRSHTAPGSQPALDQSDRGLIDTYFSDPSHVFLAIRPWSTRRCAAMLYFWSGGEIDAEGPAFELGDESASPPGPVSAAQSGSAAPPPSPAPKPAGAFDTAWYSSLAFVLSMAGLFVVDLPARHPCVGPAVMASGEPVLAASVAPLPQAAEQAETITRRAMPTGSLEPALSEAIRNRIERPVTVDIVVKVDERGRVISAEPARNYPDGLHSYLAQQAAVAARSARFRPAVTTAGTSAASTETVSFEFAPR